MARRRIQSREEWEVICLQRFEWAARDRTPLCEPRCLVRILMVSLTCLSEINPQCPPVALRGTVENFKQCHGPCCTHRGFTKLFSEGKMYKWIRSCSNAPGREKKGSAINRFIKVRSGELDFEKELHF